MKLSFHGLLCFLCGLGAGMLVAICASPLINKPGRVDQVETDTVRTEIVKHYGKLELQANTVKLDVPRIGLASQVVFIPEEKVTVVVKDSISYIMVDRQSFYTEMEDARIWHSGVESRIDSLEFTSISEKVTNTYREPDYRHSLSLYGSAGYDAQMQPLLPVGLEYLYHPKRWIGIGGRAQYDFYSRNASVLATMKLTIRWK